MRTSEEPVMIQLLLSHVLQGADGIRGFKGSKGEKVSKAKITGFCPPPPSKNSTGWDFIMSCKLDFVSYCLTNYPENREKMDFRVPKERWERGETLEKMVLQVPVEKMDLRASKASWVLRENSVLLVIQERRHVA